MEIEEKMRVVDDQAPLVSVVIPAYNSAKFIAETLESVFGQTFTDYEIILVNDGSPDTEEFESVIEPYRERLRYIKQENQGCAGARNTAIRAARGRYVAFLDADDIWVPEYLAVQVGLMERDPSVDVVYPNARSFGEGPAIGKTYMSVHPSEGEVTFESLVTERCTVFISVLARREILFEAGLFDESLRSVEDFDLWLRILKQGGRITYQNRVLVHRRRHHQSLSANRSCMFRYRQEVLSKAERTLELTPAERQAVRGQKAKIRALQRLYEGKRAFLAGATEEAIHSLEEANAFFRSRKLSLTVLLLRAAPWFLLYAYHIRNRLIPRMSEKI